MKKIVMTLFAFAFLQSTFAFAQENRHGGDGGLGGGEKRGGDNVPAENKPTKPVKPQGQKIRRNPGSVNRGVGNPNFSGGRHFKNNGQIGNQGVNRNTTPNHFMLNNQGNHGVNGVNNVQTHNPRPGGNFEHSKGISSNLKQMGVRHLPPSFNKGKMLTADAKHSTFVAPHTGPGGTSLHASMIAPKSGNAIVIQNHMKTFTGNTKVMAQINIYNTHETVANHYYWHSWNGTNYCHYYDNWGYHWYGWYWGNICFWSRWYGNNWWWYDPGYGRWCYWYDGFWWWNDPQVNVVYVYNNGQYNSANNNNAPAVSNPSSNAAAAEIDFKSKDGTREVKIIGNDAFLYDTVDSPDNKPFYLGSNVQDVKFSRTDIGRPLKIKLIFNDGTSALFDSDGNPIDTASDAPNN